MMNDETTQILSGNNVNKPEETQTPPVQSSEDNVQDKKNENISKAAYAAGGFVAGAAVTGGTLNAMTDERTEEEVVIPVAEEPEAEPTPEPVKVEEQPAAVQHETITIDPANSPSEQDVIIATDEGLRVAQVDDNKSFAQAFADARAQVGAGGVFEWHGKVYNTFYKEEWDKMSSHERAEWQSKVDYDDIRDNGADHNVQHVQQPQEPEVVDGEIRILGVGPVETENGETLNVAVLERPDGDQALLVDIDNDGTYDALIHDDNHNGNIEAGEAHDISGMNATVEDMQMAYAAQNGLHYACNDGMPDYTNDADISSMA